MSAEDPLWYGCRLALLLDDALLRRWGKVVAADQQRANDDNDDKGHDNTGNGRTAHEKSPLGGHIT
jgi:hypothetical protein